MSTRNLIQKFFLIGGNQHTKKISSTPVYCHEAFNTFIILWSFNWMYILQQIHRDIRMYVCIHIYIHTHEVAMLQM